MVEVKDIRDTGRQRRGLFRSLCGRRLTHKAKPPVTRMKIVLKVNRAGSSFAITH